MPKNVFYSWQSDRPNNLCRGFIKRALDSAIKELNGELEEANRPDEASLEVDHDTKGLPGSPDIAASILKKIEQARAFVADITPIGWSDAPEGNARKHLPNPNVMIELGYAKSALGTERIIQIWNTGFTGCGPADLPFDMRGKKGPITYNLDASAPSEERNRVLGTLTKQLKGAIHAVLATWPTESVPDRWALADSRDQSIWPHLSDGMLVNEPDHGSGVKRVYPPPRSYVRILPARWSGTDEADQHDLLLGMQGGFSWGSAQGGVLTYPGSVLYSDTEMVHAITKRFAKTGELWATRTDIAREFEGSMCIRGDSVPQDWAKFLHYAVPHVAQSGGAYPLEIRLGVTGLQGLHWPTGTNYGARPHAALEPDMELTYIIKSGDKDELWEIVRDAWLSYRRVFSLPDPGMPEMQQMRFFLTH
jgi:hypothetical protein